MFTERTAEVGRSAGDVPVSVPVLSTGSAATLEEILGGQDLLSALPAVKLIVLLQIFVLSFPQTRPPHSLNSSTQDNSSSV